MQDLKANTQVIVTIGPFVNVGDGFTPETGIDLGTADEAELIKHGSTTVVSIAAAAWAAVTGMDGYYSLTLTASHTDTEGQLTIVVQDDSVCLPVRNVFRVLSEAAYDSLYAAKDSGFMDVNVKAVSEDTTAADNCEAFFDGTGYAGTNNVIPTVTTLAGHTAQTGDSFSRIGANGSGLTSLATATDMSTLLGRITSARAGYFDNLNIGGSVASADDIDAISQSASRRIILLTVSQYERPESGSSAYTVEARTYTEDGAPVNADTTPTLTSTGTVTGNLSSKLSVASNPATGVYRWTYTVEPGDNVEQVLHNISANISATTFTLSALTQVVDFVATTFTTSDRVLLQSAKDNAEIVAGADGAKLATLQPNYTPAVAGDEMDLVDSPNATAVTAFQNGLSTFDSSSDTVNVGQVEGTDATDYFSGLVSTIGSTVTAISSALTTLSAKFTGMTSLPNWLGVVVGKTEDTTTLTEIQATPAGLTYDNTTDSLEEGVDSGAGGLDAEGIRDAVGLNEANLDQQFSDLSDTVGGISTGDPINLRTESTIVKVSSN